MTTRLPFALLSLATLQAFAADAPAPSMTATANVNIVSDYRFRGIDQTWGHPAVQGGADLAWASGFYAGTWLSNVSGNAYPGGSLEIDLYAGYNGKIDDDLGWTLGGYGYVYPGANFDRSACPSAAFATAPCALPSKSLDTFELNGGLSWKWVSYKLSVAATDYFGADASTGYAGRTSGTLYHDLGVTIPLADDLSLAAHVGRTQLKRSYGGIDPDYTDYRLSLTKTFTGGWNAGATVVGAGNDRFYRPPVGGLSYANLQTRDVNRTTLVVQVGRTF